ncbi:MAG: hypothetical protein J5521_01040 [Lachnospiraceae bacterium]|nr:hypothetical protein [Lachnospiraceae bacterium]
MKKAEVKKIILDNIAFCVMGVVFIFLTLVTRTLTVTGNLFWSFGFLLKAVPVSLITGILLGFAVNYIVKIISAGIGQRELPAAKDKQKCLWVFFVALGVLFLAYIPYFLAYYPGILAYDSYIQIGQIFTGEYNEHHPLFHTLTIRAAVFAGQNIFNSLNAGIAAYVLTQMLLLSAVFSYGIFCLYKRGFHIFSFVTLGILAVFPFNGFMAVSVTKDIPFAVFFLLAVIALTELLLFTDKKTYILNAVLLFISLIMCVLFRNNGKYSLGIAFAVCLIILIVKAFKKSSKEKKKEIKRCGLILLGAFVSLVISLLALLVISKSLNAVQGDRREMLSVPIQQLARTYVYHAGAGVLPEDDNTMDEESKALINEFILNDGAKLYRQDISDPVKRNTNTWVVVNKTSEFVKVYCKLFFKYPEDYINAFIAQNAGFVDIGDTSHAYINDPDEVKGHGYVQTKWEDSLYVKGFYQDSKWPALRALMDEFADNNGYLKIPLLKYIFMPGIYFWFFVLALIYAIKKKNIGLIAIVSLIAGYYATMFFGPTVQLRYVYPVMIVVPFLIPVFFREVKRTDG